MSEFYMIIIFFGVWGKHFHAIMIQQDDESLGLTVLVLGLRTCCWLGPWPGPREYAECCMSSCFDLAVTSGHTLELLMNCSPPLMQSSTDTSGEGVHIGLCHELGILAL
jgi:hypothetical protein